MTSPSGPPGSGLRDEGRGIGQSRSACDLLGLEPAGKRKRAGLERRRSMR